MSAAEERVALGLAWALEEYGPEIVAAIDLDSSGEVRVSTKP